MPVARVSRHRAIPLTAPRECHTPTSLRHMQEEACREMFASVPAGTVVHVSFFENCGDHCYDLLNDRSRLQIRTGIKDGEAEERVHVQGLTEVPAGSAEEATMLMQAGSALRATHPTQRNPDSSRSHAICTLTLRKIPATRLEGEVVEGAFAGMLRVVDLAGSERREDVYEHSMDRINEMKEINWSLGCLKECIRGLFIRETSTPDECVYAAFDSRLVSDPWTLARPSALCHIDTA